MNKYIELTVYTNHDGGDVVSAVFWDYTDLGVVIYDVQDVIDLDKSGKAWDYADEKIYSADKTVLVKGYFPIDEQEKIAEVKAEIQSLQGDFGSLETVTREIDGDEWRERWKEHFKPIHIGKVVIVPEWIKYNTAKDEIPVYLDSNMAFGTGEHETTSMCIEMLERYVNKTDVVLDVGCGSGILGIVASKLGAKEVVMTDIDECAVDSAKHNSKLNNVHNATVLLKNLLDDNTVKGNVIVANIMAEVLIFFSDYIVNNLKDNGVIILSGILNDRADKVLTAYENKNFTFIDKEQKGEWTCLVLRKK